MKASLAGRIHHGSMVSDLRRLLVEAALSHFQGNHQKTVDALGIGLRTLGLWLKQWRDEKQAA